MPPAVREWLWLIAGVLSYVLVAMAIGMLLAYCAVGSAHAGELRRGELEILARVVQAETTGEPEAGQRAVAWTAINRMRRAPDTYGATITKVVSRAYQYAKPAPLNESSTAYLKALLATVRAVLGEGGDVSQGATHFHRCDMKRYPAWARRLQPTVRLGRHCFYK